MKIGGAYTNATEKGFETVLQLTDFESGAQALAVCNGLKKDGATVRNAYASDGEFFVEVVLNSKAFELLRIEERAEKVPCQGYCLPKFSIYRKQEAYGDKIYYLVNGALFYDFERIGD